MSGRTILYVEDEEYDVLFMRRAFARVLPQHQLEIAPDGHKAIEHLSKGSATPDLVLLDLNLPLMSGFEVLTWMRQQPVLSKLPVVIFSSSARPEDRSRASELGANEYVQKPSSALDFGNVLKGLDERWFKSDAACQ
jgi:CheY-like chemotaxis protein